MIWPGDGLGGFPDAAGVAGSDDPLSFISRREPCQHFLLLRGAVACVKETEGYEKAKRQSGRKFFTSHH